ncbi:O-antigen ligase family protein [Mannheimia sp. E30BD]|uniref:O-antigen ligase family protein n=1 Tax=Mannheimia sp. E30BD TaxID=3278708 RepID=UPI00359D1848
MLHHLRKIEKPQITLFVNILVAAFFVTVLTFKKGYSYVPMTLGVIATFSFLYYRFKLKIKWQLDKEDKYFIYALIAYFLAFPTSVITNQDSIRIIDTPSRVLLFIPLIFLFSLYPIKKITIFYFIPIGSLIIGILAIYQKFILKLHLPFPEIMIIQAGDICMTLSLLSIVISFYWFNRNIKIAALCILCAILGLVASILTGARGGWIAFPFCFLLILVCYYKNINKKILLMIVSFVVIAISLLITRPEFGFQQRYDSAKADVINYINNGVKESSQGARLDMWKNALIAISEKPILGHGSLGYEEFRKRQINSGEMSNVTLDLNSLHNQYLEAFVKRGIAGFLTLMTVLIIPLIIFTKRLKTKDMALKCIAVLGIIHIISHSFFFLTQSYLAHNSGSIFYFFTLILLYHLVKQKEKNI